MKQEWLYSSNNDKWGFPEIGVPPAGPGRLEMYLVQPQAWARGGTLEQRVE